MQSHRNGHSNGENIKEHYGDDTRRTDIELYLLLQMTHIDISFDVFRILLNLLRDGVTPEAVFVFLQQITPHSRIFKKIKKKNESKTLNDMKRIKSNDKLTK